MLIAAPAAVPVVAAEEFAQDFAREPIDGRRLRIVGAYASHAIRRDPTGLAVHLPSHKPGKRPVGVETRFQVAGDFEITAGFDAFEASAPNKGHGAGVLLRIAMFRDPPAQATLARFHRPRKGQVYVTAITPRSASKSHRREENFATNATRGRLRLARNGPTLRFLVAENGSRVFRELRQIRFGTEELSRVALLVDTGGSDSPITVHLTGLLIRADAFPPVGSSKAHRKEWILFALSSIAGLATLVRWAVCWLRRKRVPKVRPFS